MRLQAIIKDKILEGLCETFGGSKGLRYYIEYLKTGKCDNELANIYLEKKVGKISTSNTDEKLKEENEKLKKQLKELEEQDEKIIIDLQNKLAEAEEKLSSSSTSNTEECKQSLQTYIKRRIMTMYNSIAQANGLLEYISNDSKKKQTEFLIKAQSKEFKQLFGQEPNQKAIENVDKLVQFFLGNN